MVYEATDGGMNIQKGNGNMPRFLFWTVHLGSLRALFAFVFPAWIGLLALCAPADSHILA